MAGPDTLHRPRPDFMPHPDVGDGDLMKRPASGEVAVKDPAELVKRPEGTLAVPETATEGDPLRIVLTSLDKNIDNFAREAAHEKLAQKHEGPFWKKAVMSFWHNVTHEYQLVKATNEAREEILKSGNLRHHHGKEDTAWKEATVSRYGSDYGEQLVHADRGETYHKLGAEEAENDPNAQRIREDMLDSVRKYAKGEIADRASFEMMLDRKAEEWRKEGIGKEYIGEGQLLAHNAFDMAEQAKATLDGIEGLSDIDRDAKLEQMLASAEIVTGEAKVGSNVEIKESLSERLAEKLKGVEWLNNERLAAVTAFLTNETTMGIMLSVGAIGLKNAISRAGAMIIPGLGAGIVAAVRERRALLDERALMERRSDAGIGFDSEVKAQIELDATLYESRPVGELLNELGDLYDEHGELAMRDRDGLNRAMELQAEIKARMQISDRDGKRLINFSDIDSDQMEDRRFDLDLAMAKLESDMKKAFENPVAQAMLDIKPEENFDALMADQKDIMVGMLSGEMKEKDRVFNKLLASRMMKRFIWTALPVGLMVEGFNHASTFIANVVTDWLGRSVSMDDIVLASQGMPLSPDHIGSGGPAHIGAEVGPDHLGSDAGPDHVGKTTVEGPDHIGSGGPGHIGAESQGPDHIGSAAGPDHIGADNAENGPSHIGEKPGTKISETSKIKTPEGFNTEISGDKVKLTAPDGKVFNLEVAPDGSLTKESLEVLNKGGLNVLDHQDPIEGKPVITQKEVSAPDFVQNHKDEMVQIKTTKWFHNNTTQFDLNELKTQNHVDAQGNVIISIKGMTEGGSFNGSSGINWKEAANQGLLKTYLSASQGTQAHAFEFTFGPNGELMVPNDSPARAMFDTNGKFTAGYEQISLKGDTLPDGTVGIATLSTVVGEDRPTLVDTIKTPTVATGHSYTLTQIQPQAYPMPPAAPIIPTVPVGGRRKLEEGEEPETPTPIIPLTPIAAAPTGGGPELPPAPERRAITSAESNASGAEAYTAEEQQFLDQVEAEKRSFPIGFSAETFGNYSGPSQKLAIKLLHEAIEGHPRLIGEGLDSYQARIARELRAGVGYGRTKLAAFPPKIRPMVEDAFKLLLEVNQPGGGKAGARAA